VANKKAKAEEVKEDVKEEATPQDEVEVLKEQNKDLEDRLLRQMAEFDNFRKRTLKEKEEIGVISKMKCIGDLLPVLDNFERALGAESKDADFKKGVEMIFSSLVDTLNKMGVEEIKAEGEPFDPGLHYAVSIIEDENLGKNVVANVMQKGYKLGDKVIRHAMVAVANS